MTRDLALWQISDLLRQVCRFKIWWDAHPEEP